MRFARSCPIRGLAKAMHRIREHDLSGKGEYREFVNLLSTIATLPDPADPLTDLIRRGARQLIAQALMAVLIASLSQFPNATTPEGHARLVRLGHLPEREILTGVDSVPMNVSGVRDRAVGAEKVQLTSSILPPYLHKANSVGELLPWPYLRGISSAVISEPGGSSISGQIVSTSGLKWRKNNVFWMLIDADQIKDLHQAGAGEPFSCN